MQYPRSLKITNKMLFKKINWSFSLRAVKIKGFKVVTSFIVILILFICHTMIYLPYYKRIPSDGIACFSKNILDGIPDILDDENPPPKGKSIFFHETSCNTAEGLIIQLNARQACAVESAANLNPDSTVYLLYASPIRYPNVSMFSSKKYSVLHELLKYKNIKIRRVDLKRYIQNTPLEDWFQTGQLNRSSYVNSHTSDVLRFLSLWRYGGTYMDLDIVLMRSLQSEKPNFAGAESAENVAAGVLNFDHKDVGHHLAELCLREIGLNFKGDEWGYNGPGVITRVLKEFCKSTRTDNMYLDRCKGFNVLPPSAFYPIHWKIWRLYFDAKRINLALKQVHYSYAIHVWNKFSFDTTVYTKKPDVAYGYIAKKFCPNVYRASGDTF